MANPTSIARWWRHLTMTRWQLRQIFPDTALHAMTQAVRDSEQRHGGELRIAVEADWPLAALWQGITPRQRAAQVFAQLQVWDTAARNGVLIYLSLADHQLEIVADRGFNGRVSPAEWQQLCRQFEQRCAAHQYQQAMLEIVSATGALIAQHFPAADHNEQVDQPVLL